MARTLREATAISEVWSAEEAIASVDNYSVTAAVQRLLEGARKLHPVITAPAVLAAAITEELDGAGVASDVTAALVLELQAKSSKLLDDMLKGLREGSFSLVRIFRGRQISWLPAIPPRSLIQPIG